MRISIITPTLNRAAFLPVAIESVCEQNFADCEHIVVDGLSTDATPEVLARYPHLRVIREPDSGLYDALNKGIRAAGGDVIGHLNSDDLYLPGTFAAVATAFSDPAVEVVSGGAEIVAPEREPGRSWRRREEIALTFESATVGAPLPNARFFRRGFYERVGLYETAYRVAADREFLLRAALAEPCALEVEQLFYRYCEHEGSLTFNRDPVCEARWRDEYLAIAEKYLRRPGLPEEARRCLRRWHLRESAQAALRTRRWSYVQRGLRWNASWPWMFLRHLGGALFRR
jgi:hypothetical protein